LAAKEDKERREVLKNQRLSDALEQRQRTMSQIKREKSAMKRKIFDKFSKSSKAQPFTHRTPKFVNNEQLKETIKVGKPVFIKKVRNVELR